MMGHGSVHGGVDGRELAAAGVALEDCLDFSTNVNPYGPPPAAVRAAQRAIERGAYPDRQSWRLRQELAGRLGVDPDSVVVGNGSAELIWALARALAPSFGFAIAGPTFSGYADAVAAAGGNACEIRLDLEDSQWDARGLAAALAQTGCEVAFVCTPNNPTGHAPPPALLAGRLTGMKHVIVDQAYVNFLGEPNPAPPLPAGDNLIVLRSFTKDFGLAGMRLGYLVAAESLAADVRRQLPPWNVNVAAQAAGLACLDEAAFLTDSMDRVRQDAAALVQGLRSIGLRPLPTAMHFVLVKVPSSGELRSRLLQTGILIRDCASFGLDGYIRLAARPKPDVERLLTAMAELTASAPALRESTS